MMFRDRVNVELYEDTGEEDRYGDPIFGWVDHGPVAAEVDPVGTEQTISADGTRVSTRYQVVLAPRTELLHDRSGVRLTWRGARFVVEGDVLHVTAAGGRVHHYRAIGRRS